MQIQSKCLGCVMDHCVTELSARSVYFVSLAGGTVFFSEHLKTVSNSRHVEN